MPDPLISVVILSWNRKDEVRRTLEELSKSDFKDFEIILVDNASSDGTDGMIVSDYPAVKFIRLPNNGGIYGYNVGFANARGKYIVVLDDDSHPSSDALEKVAVQFESDKDNSIGIIAFHIINNITGRDFTASWPSGDWIAFWGCGAAIRREVLEEVGYYDETFFIYANEYDLSIRVLNAGWRVIYRPEIIAFHRECKKHRSWKRTGLIGGRNEAWFHLKYFPWWLLGVAAALTCTRYTRKAFAKRSLAYGYYCLMGYSLGWIKFHVPLKKRQRVKLRIIKQFFKHHWLFAPVARRLVASLRRC